MSLRSFASVTLFVGLLLLPGCASDSRRVTEIEHRLRALERSPAALEAQAILERLPDGERRLVRLDQKFTQLEETLASLESMTERLETASAQANEVVARIEKLEQIEQFGKYGEFLLENRERLLNVLASVEAQYRQVSRQAPGLVQARELQIVNAAGEVLASLGEDAVGASQLQLFSSAGKELVSLGASDTRTGGRMVVRDNVGGAALDLWVDHTGAGGLRTARREGGTLVELTHDEADGRLHVHSGFGPAVALGIVDGTDGTIETWDEAGNTLVRLGSMSSGGGSMTVYDKRESPVVLLRAIETDGKVDVRGSNGRARELRP